MLCLYGFWCWRMPNYEMYLQCFCCYGISKLVTLRLASRGLDSHEESKELDHEWSLGHHKKKKKNIIYILAYNTFIINKQTKLFLFLSTWTRSRITFKNCLSSFIVYCILSSHIQVSTLCPKLIKKNNVLHSKFIKKKSTNSLLNEEISLKYKYRRCHISLLQWKLLNIYASMKSM